ncbi:MAG: hypothetical protein PHR56_06385 [Dehalococcoidales bacterium]|nr:hypothetical protein [Dehalococcoidales bacterium]
MLAFRGRERRCPMAVQGTKAGMLPAVAYSMEVPQDSYMVRTTTNESKRFMNIGKGGKPAMADTDTIFVLTREDVVGCAREMGIPDGAITDDILAQVKKAWSGD